MKLNPFHPHQLLVRDAFRLKQLERQQPAKWASELALAEQRYAARLSRIPTAWPYPDNLPIVQAKDEILAAIQAHQVIVLCGETGSGKTTQLPKLCLELGRGTRGLIGHTQPRRLAARAVATRIAAELGSTLSSEGIVGFETRFDRRSSDQNLIKLMTDGILLAELQRDKFLTQYDTIIIDEAHERSLNIDFLLGILKQLLPKRPDLKLIITSATLDPERLSKHFNGCPIVSVSGRTFPVEVLYQPPAPDEDHEDSVLQAVETLWGSGKFAQADGDILVFLPGEREINDLHRVLSGRWPQADVLPLYSRLASQAQDQVFRPSKKAKIVLATNVAETSITVPGIRYVIDTGTARLSRFNPRTGVQQLQIEAISQAAANQRAGRCGRVQAGICLRLYAEDDYASRPEFTDPEILRSNLAGVILTMLNLRLGTMEAFPWVQAPEGRHVQEGWRVLDLLGIVDAAQQLTPLGRELARLPLDPRIARIAWAGKGQAIAPMVAVLAAALSVQDPHEMPAEAQDSARAKHKEWRHEKSDFLSLWQLWTRYQAARADMGQKKLRQWCKQHFVSYVRLEEWHNVAVQIGELLGLKDLSATFDEGFYPHLHQALLAGLCDQIGQKDSRPSDKKDKKPQGKRPPAAEYNGVRGKRFKIFPASTLIKSTPEWLVAANVTLTSQLFARTCASIEPTWLERAAPHLLKKVLHQPQWNPERGEVSATEQVSFLGMLIGKHRRHYGSGQPREARVLFIQHALVAGEWPKKPAFLQANFDLIDSIRDKEIKLRRPDLLADESQWFAFYDQRIPAEVCTCQGLVQWLKSQPKDLLLMQEKHLLRTGANTDIAAFFPDHVLMGGIDLKLSYHHDPSAEADGVSFHLPLSALYALPEAGFEWLVPGLLPLKIEGLFKTLPVHLRRLASPMREYADALASSLSVREGVLIEALCQRFKAMTGVQFQPEDFQPDKLPPFLRPRLLVEDQGKVLAEGTSLSALQQKLAPQARQQLAQHPFNQKQVKAWSFGDLPAQVGTGFPALCAEGEVVHLQLFESQNAAETAHRNGVAALLLQQWGSKDVIKLIKSLGGVHLIANGWQADVLGQQLAEKAVSALVGHAPRQQAAFQQLEGRRGEFYKLAFDHAQEWATWLPLLQEIRHKLKTAPPEAAQDIQQQLTALFAAGYMQQIPTAQWPRVRVYLKAILLRLERWKPQRDADCQKQIRAFSVPSFHPAHWLLEEWRVLLFAQELKAVGGPSGEKIKALLVP